MQEAKQILIIGGVAGGASCAARLGRLSEAARIVVFDRGPYVSFANCGLPYYVGDVIRDEAKLLVASAELFRERFGIEVHTEHDVTGIDRHARTITVRALRSGGSRVYPYDALVLSPGAAPIRPPIPGIDLDGVFSLRTIPDSRRVRDWIASKGARRALVVGAASSGSRWRRTWQTAGSRSRCSRRPRSSCPRSIPRWPCPSASASRPAG